MGTSQPGILNPVPEAARYIEFIRRRDRDPRTALAALAGETPDSRTVIGFGPGLVALLGDGLEPLRPFPAFSGPGCDVPSTQADIWCWLGGDDDGEILHRGRHVTALLAEGFEIGRLVDGFKTGGGRDLGGYEDGTENPEGAAAVAAAIAHDIDGVPDGSSFVAVQQWVHDLGAFAKLPQAERDDIIGRRLSDNVELDDAPLSAHVKRTAQESFSPEAFVLRRSMPWASADGEGLMFVAFGRTLDAFEAQMRRMAGLDDAIVDGIFRMSRPVSGGYYWCPPTEHGKLSLAPLKL